MKDLIHPRTNTNWLLLLLWLFASSFCLCWAQAQDFQKLLGAVKTYAFGQDTKSLVALETMAAMQSNDEASRKTMAAALAALLGDPATTFASKQFVCRQLALIGSDAEVPALAPLLLDPQLSDMARYALARIGGEAAGEALRGALAQASGRNLIGVINSVGRLRVPRADERLVELLRSEDSEVAEAAAVALGRIISARSELTCAGGSRFAGPLRAAVAQSCLDLGYRLLDFPLFPAAGNMFQAAFRQDCPANVRAAALQGWVEASAPRGRFDLVTRGLADPSPEVQAMAARSVPGVASAERMRQLLSVFTTLSAPIKVVLLHALEGNRSPASRELAFLASSDEDVSVRIAALDVLGSVGSAAEVEALVERAAHATGEEKQMARRSLARMTDPRTNQELARLLVSPAALAPAQEVEVIEALAERQATAQAGPVLLRAGGQRSVNRAAIRATGRLATEEHLSELVHIMLTSEWRAEAEDALVSASRRTGSEDRVARLLAEYSPLSPEQKALSYQCLGRLGADAGLPVLREALSDPDAALRLEAVRGLSAWPTAAPAADLLAVARKPVAPSEGVLALRGYLDVVARDRSIGDDGKVERYRAAMAVASDPAEKRRVLAKLGAISSFSALNQVMTYVNTKDIQAEAASAAIQIAGRVYPENLGISRIVVEQLARNPSPEVIKQAAELLVKIDALAAKHSPRRLPSFELRVINAESRFEAGAIVDLNNDGRRDVFSGGFWYEAPDWKRHKVRDVAERDGYYLDFGAGVTDVDGDGRQDIINGSWHGKDVFWLRNDSAGEFEVIPIDQPGNLETVIGVDISGDGLLDILPNTVASMQWYECRRDAGAPGGARWTRHDLPKETAGHGIGTGDVNGDGRVDIVTPKGWLEQPAPGQPDRLWRPEFDLGSTSVPILVHDVDADGDSDLVWGNGHGYGVYWLEQRAEDGGRVWEKHLVDRTWSQPHFWLLADLDLDGRPEMVTGKRYYAHNGNDPGEEHPLCIYAYQYDPAGKSWIREAIHEGGRVGFGIFTTAADIDGDGDLDLLAPGKSGLYLLENMLR